MTEVTSRARRGACGYRTVSADRVGDPACLGLLSAASDRTGDFVFRRAVQPVGGALALGGIHAHVQWTVRAQAEASIRIGELGERNSEIEKDSVDPAQPALAFERSGQAAEIAVFDRKPRIPFLEHPGRLHRLRVAVHCMQAAARAETRENRPTVPAAPVGRVNVAAFGIERQAVKRFLQQRGFMLDRSVCIQSCTALRAASTDSLVPTSSALSRQRAASHNSKLRPESQQRGLALKVAVLPEYRRHAQIARPHPGRRRWHSPISAFPASRFPVLPDHFVPDFGKIVRHGR